MVVEKEKKKKNRHNIKIKFEITGGQQLYGEIEPQEQKRSITDSLCRITN